MLKQHYAYISFLRVLCDTLIIGLLWNGVYFLRFYSGWFAHHGIPSYSHFAALTLPVLLIFFLCRKARGIYRSVRVEPIFSHLRKQIESLLLGYVFVILFLYYSEKSPYSRVFLFLFLFSLLAGVPIAHLAMIQILRFFRSRGYNLRHYGIIGTGKNAMKLFRQIRDFEYFGLNCCFFIDNKPHLQGKTIDGIPVYGHLDRLPELARKNHLDEIYLTRSGLPIESISGILNELQANGITIRLLPDWTGLVSFAKPSAVTLGSCVLFTASESPLIGVNILLKDILDRLTAAVLIILLAMPMLLIACLIKITSGWPVLYRQRRMGMDQREFEILKFRTMNAADASEPTWTVRNDPRQTKLGKFLRRFGLDELPQLFNVFKGQMSLVGPRPEQPHFVKTFSKTYKKYMFRHKVKAGMTGWAQIHGFRGDTSIRKRIQYDLYYVQNWSYWLDLQILIRTPFHILKGKNGN